MAALPVSSEKARHEWIMTSHRPHPATQYPFDGQIFRIDTHRNHRGPYTGAGDLLRTIVQPDDDAIRALVQTHAITILSIAPELERRIAVSPELAKSFTFSREGNPRSWTLRLAHGLTDFLLNYFSLTSSSPCAISFENADHADPTDQEFIANTFAPRESRRSVAPDTHIDR